MYVRRFSLRVEDQAVQKLGDFGAHWKGKRGRHNVGYVFRNTTPVHCDHVVPSDIDVR